jgi:GT2 family glycosyltransferase
MSSQAEIVDVSAIVVTFNRDEPLCQTLKCLLSQRPAPRELIVVDQTREHNKVTQDFLDELIEQRRIEYIWQSEPNAQRARNTAIKETRGKVLLFLDDDVVMDQDLVGAHWKNYEDSDLAAVCGFYLEPGEGPVNKLPAEMQNALTGWLYFPHCYTERIECHLFPSCNGSVLREVAIKLGGFDENYTYTLLDDTDFACRLKALGVKSVHDPESRLIHLKEPAGGKRAREANDYVIADSNRWYTWCYFFWTNFGWRSWQELTWRLRRTVFRRKNLLHPQWFLVALWHSIRGGCRAARAVYTGRKLLNASAAPGHHEEVIPVKNPSGSIA